MRRLFAHGAGQRAAPAALMGRRRDALPHGHGSGLSSVYRGGETDELALQQVGRRSELLHLPLVPMSEPACIPARSSGPKLTFSGSQFTSQRALWIWRARVRWSFPGP